MIDAPTALLISLQFAFLRIYKVVQKKIYDVIYRKSEKKMIESYSFYIHIFSRS